MEMPAKSEFPGTGDGGNGISPTMKSQGDWIRSVKSGGCTACHALGTKATREIPAALGPFPNTAAAWDRRVKSGQAGAQMSGGAQSVRPRARAEDVRGLDRSDPCRRASAGAAAAAGHRAQRRHHAVGLGRSQGLPARRRLDRPAESARQCQRTGLRLRSS